MIERILVNNSTSFKHIDIKVCDGFNVISGVSGAGKSVFFNLILSALGKKEAEAELVELDIALPCDFDSMESNLDSKQSSVESSSKDSKDSKTKKEKKAANIESKTKDSIAESKLVTKARNMGDELAKDSIKENLTKDSTTKNLAKDSKQNALKLAGDLKQSTKDSTKDLPQNFTNIFENYGILLDDDTEKYAIFKVIKKNNNDNTATKPKYFINNQSIAKKRVNEITNHFVKYISIKDASELESENLLFILDNLIAIKSPKFAQILSEYKHTFLEYKSIKSELQNISEKQKNIENLKEFAKFEINKIEGLNPQIGEYDRLIAHKKNLSKKEKVLSACEGAIAYLDSIDVVNKALELLDVDSAAFQSVMLDVRGSLYNAMSEYENMDVEPEALLDRIAALGDMLRRYGSEEEALKHLEKQKKFLSECENIEFDKSNLQKKCNILESKCVELCEKITQNRKDSIPALSQEMSYFSHKLRLGDITFSLNACEMGESGGDRLEILLDLKSKNVLSSGEYNRVRLSALCAMVSIENMRYTKPLSKSANKDSRKSGILILDEIDANLSGEESEGVAELLAFLSQKYQIFAISHQPFMPIFADNHFLITKDSKNIASIKLLDDENKIKEIARMISGSHLDSNAINYVTKLLEKHKQRM